MSYEVEPLSAVVTPTDASITNSPVMREERVINPYITRPSAETKVTTEPVGQTNTTEEKTQTTEEQPQAEVRLTPQMAALARKEQVFRKKEQEFKAKVQMAEAERQELAALRALKAKLSAKDYSGIEELVPYGDYSQYLINKNTQLSPEQEALKKVASELEAVKEAQKNDIDRRYESAVQERRQAVSELVAQSEEYRTIKNLKQEEAVVQHILDTWENDDVELPIEQATKEVEFALKEHAKQWASVVNINTEPTPEAKQALPPMKAGVNTITNDMTIQGEVKHSRKSFQGMTDTQRYEEARKRALEKLKQGIR